MHRARTPVNFVGLKNYVDILADPVIWRSFATTLWYVIVSVTGQFVVGFGLALLLNRPIPGKGLLTTLLLLPMMLSPVVVGLFWKLIYDPSWGILNYALGLGKTAWLTDANLALYAVAITDIWMWSPFVMLLSLAGLSAVPKHLYEAASIDRAGQALHVLPRHPAAGRADPPDRRHLPHHGGLQDLRHRVRDDRPAAGGADLVAPL